MENKASLIRASKELKRLQEELVQASADAEEFSFSITSKIQLERDKMLREFEVKKENLKKEVSSEAKLQFDQIIYEVNRNPPEIEEVTQLLEDTNLLNSIYKIMSEDQVEAYIPTSLKYIPKESLKREIQLLQQYAEAIPREADYTVLLNRFNYVDKLLNTGSTTTQSSDENIDEIDVNKKGKSDKQAKRNRNMYAVLGPIFILLLVFIFLLVKIAAVLMMLYIIYAVLQFRSTYNVKRFLNLYASILENIGYGENADIVRNSREDIISQVSTYIESCENEYIEKIDNIQYKEDYARISTFKEKLQNELVAKRVRIDKLKSNIDLQSKEVERIQAELERLEQERAKQLLTLEQRYLTFDNIQWSENLPEDIYLGKNKKGTPVLFPVIHGNMLFVSQEQDYLFEFVKLFVMQIMMKVHPDYVSQSILDYKYMAGNLQQFMNLPQRSISIFLEKEKIDSKLSDFNIDVLARNRNILRSVNSIEEFNALMREYDSVGECYIFIHIFGLQQVNELYTNLLRNGPKVGYYFYIYLTMEEFKELKSEILLDLIQEYYFIGDMPGVGIYPDRRLRMVMSSYLTTK